MTAKHMSLNPSFTQAVFHGIAQCPQFHRNRFTHCSREVRTFGTCCMSSCFHYYTLSQLLGCMCFPYVPTRFLWNPTPADDGVGRRRTPHRLPSYHATTWQPNVLRWLHACMPHMGPWLTPHSFDPRARFAVLQGPRQDCGRQAGHQRSVPQSVPRNPALSYTSLNPRPNCQSHACHILAIASPRANLPIRPLQRPDLSQTVPLVHWRSQGVFTPQALPWHSVVAPSPPSHSYRHQRIRPAHGS